MTQILCKIIGHREYDDEVLEVQPWQDRDFSGYAQEDFRETHCLRCGEALIAGDEAVAA